jgi:hypothetical protein
MDTQESGAVKVNVNVEELYKELLSKAEELYKYAVTRDCENAKKLAEELLKREPFTWTYADDLRFYVNVLVKHACYNIGNAELVRKYFRRGIWGHLSKRYGPLPYPD